MAETPIEKINSIKSKIKTTQGDWIKVGYSTCGIAAGAKEVFDVLVEEAKKQNIDISIRKAGCAGMCYAEPLIEVHVEGMPQVYYGKVDAGKAREILERHVVRHTLVDDHIYDVKTDKK